ncbi:MAG: flagellar basal body-associated FliL family protein [Amaricoccus sp.]
MTDVVEIAEAAPAPRPKGKLGLIVGLVAALALGGGGFYAVYAGLLDPGKLLGGGGHGGGHGAEGESGAASVVGDVAFVALDPIMISLAPNASAKHLRFSGQLEVAPAHAAEVAALMPRVLDVLNTYLRAVDVRDLEAPAALARLRAQMLRRIQVVTGEGMVRDLLVTEFVLN